MGRIVKYKSKWKNENWSDFKQRAKEILNSIKEKIPEETSKYIWDEGYNAGLLEGIGKGYAAVYNQYKEETISKAKIDG